MHFIEELLETYVRKDFSPQWKIRGGKEPKLFRGVKFYPPLGTNPWPERKKDREKVAYIYQFCERHSLPLITHCDDQGFRGVTAKLAQQYTNPGAWNAVLEHYPQLKVDFAHYGRQYNPIGKSPIKALLDKSWTNDPWFTEIIDLMARFDTVYADFSFSGSDPNFYQELHTFIYDLEEDELRERILNRSMFGTDFTVNLAKVESYTNYLRIFEQSPFSDSDIERFVCANPMRFLNLEK